MTTQHSRRLLAALSVLALLVPGLVRAQTVAPTRHWNGQAIAPVYEGFDVNPDGSFNMWFGYMNRNFEEEVDVPVGADNRIEPGIDRGQPTHFDPRRHKDVFSVVVPKDFGETNKLVWSITVRGKTETIAGTLNRVWQIDRVRATRGGNSQNINSNTPPVVQARLERVVRPDRNVDGFLVVPVHVAEPHVERPVRVDVETLVHRRHALAGRMADGDELGRTGLGKDRKRGDGSDDDS